MIEAAIFRIDDDDGIDLGEIGRSSGVACSQIWQEQREDARKQAAQRKTWHVFPRITECAVDASRRPQIAQVASVRQASNATPTCIDAASTVPAAWARLAAADGCQCDLKSAA